MARSSYIYIVMGAISRKPVASFTVKYELLTWLRTRRGLSTIRVFRTGDGISQDRPVELDFMYMLANPTEKAKVLQ